MKKIYLLLTFIFLITFYSFVNYIIEDSNGYMVAITESVEKANDIQELLTTKERETIRVIVTKIDNSIAYGILVKDSKYYKATEELLNSDILDSTVQLAINPKYIDNEKKMIKRYEKELADVLWNMFDLKSITVKIYPDFENKTLNSINIYFETKEDADNIAINAKVHTFIKSLNIDIEPDKIHIYNFTAEDKARDLAIQAKLEINLQQYLKIDKEIKKHPNNPNLYIERGYLLELFDRQKSLEDFKYAAKLNPNLAEAYVGIGMRYLDPSFELHNAKIALENFLKAYELSGGDDFLCSVISTSYQELKDYQKAVEWYEKIKAPIYHDIKYIAEAYAELGQYDKALSLIEKALSMEESLCDRKELKKKKRKYSLLVLRNRLTLN